MLSPNRGLSQIAASFVGSWCQGIPLALFVAWPCVLFWLIKSFSLAEFRLFSCYLLEIVVIYLKTVFLLTCFFLNNMLSRFIICFLLYSVFKVLKEALLLSFEILLRKPVSDFSSKKRKTHFFCFLLLFEPFGSWWAQVDSNHRPHAYQACALTCWAISPCLVLACACGGDERDRTDDPLLAKQVLSQLSYTPIFSFWAMRMSFPSSLRLSFKTLKIKQRLTPETVIPTLDVKDKSLDFLSSP